MLAYDPALDGLRALAIIAVLGFHLDLPIFRSGFIGVDIFYVISGYLMTRIIFAQIGAGRFDYRDFIVRRARRLLPALLVTVAITMLGAVLLMSPAHLGAAARSAAFAAISLSNWHFWLEGDYFAASKHVRPLLHTWSLGVEVQFYLIWPLFASVIMWLGTPIRQLAGLLLLALISFVGAVSVQFVDPQAGFYLSPFRLWQFAAGGCIALFCVGFVNLVNGPLRLAAGVAGFGLLIGAAILITPNNYYSIPAAIPTLGTGLLILASRTPVLQKTLGFGPLVYIGKISYSLYLVHWPIIILYRYYVFRPLDGVEIVLCVIGSVLAAIALYHLVETRFRSAWSDAPARDFRLVGARLGFAMLALVGAGGLVSHQGGWDWRLAGSSRAVMPSRLASGLSCGHDIDAMRYTGCQFGALDAETSGKLLMVGDSHALALAHGVKATLHESGMAGRLFVRLGTLPFQGVTTFGGKWKAGDFGNVFETLPADADDTIILHARFDQYWWASDETTRRLTWIGTGDGSPEEIAASRRAFKTGLQNTLTALEKTGASVLVVGAVPYLGLDHPQCYMRPRFVINERQAKSQCAGYSRTASLERAGGVNTVLRASVEAAGFIFVDPVDVLCPLGEPTCSRIHNGELLYSDDNHLSFAGAVLLSGAIADELHARDPVQWPEQVKRR